MSIQQAAAQAVAAVAHARSLFESSPEPPPTDSRLGLAADTTSVAGQRASVLSGDLIDAHRGFVDEQAPRLTRAGQTDNALSSYLDTAGRLTRAGASKLDVILANTRSLAGAATGTTSAGEQRMLAQALRNQVSQAGAVVSSTQQQASGIANGIRLMGYGTTTKPKEGPDFVTGPKPEQGPNADQRRKNQIDAFRQVFGRDPVSKSDWSTAAALDPNTYDPKFNGTKSVVKVVRINPVPGQGVVRSSQWIPDHDVRSFPFWTHDLGNNRGPDANFDPEDTKVTTVVDYDNGIVVMRQNPSVLENSDGSPGEVRVGTPTGSVTQLDDGSVRIKYDAGNPFAPGISRSPDWTDNHPVTVNGDLVFTPGANGVTVNGTRTDYPWMEVYQDMPNGTTHTVLIDPSLHGGQEGPMTNLPWHHDVGTGGKAFAPFDTGGWNPKYDVRIPLTPTPFGDVGNPPSAAPPPPPLPPGTVPA